MSWGKAGGVRRQSAVATVNQLSPSFGRSTSAVAGHHVGLDRPPYMRLCKEPGAYKGHFMFWKRRKMCSGPSFRGLRLSLLG